MIDAIGTGRQSSILLNVSLRHLDADCLRFDLSRLGGSGGLCFVQWTALATISCTISLHPRFPQFRSSLQTCSSRCRQESQRNVVTGGVHSPVADDGPLQQDTMSSARAAARHSGAKRPQVACFVGVRGIVGEIPDTSVIVSHAVGRANASNWLGSNWLPIELEARPPGL